LLASRAVKLERLSEDWNELAEEDALWAVLAEPGKQGGRWDVEDFLATGEREVAGVLSTAEGLGLPEGRGKALDFGCGVGRLTRALSAQFEECVGVDISKEMVERARELNADRPNTTFVVNVAPDLSRFEDASFGFVYSSKVLQHMPSGKLASEYVAEFVRVTKPGGLVVFQLWTHIPWRNRLQSRRRAYGLLRALRFPQRILNRLGLTPMGRGISVAEATIRNVIEDSGGRVIHTEPDGEWGLRYFAAKGATSKR
jgi:SAM-dependent methyltransferase